MSRRLPPVPRGALDAAPDDSTRAHQTLSELWIAALKTHRDQTGNDLAESDLVRSIVACGTTEAVLSIIDARTQQFKEFRKYGGKSKEALKRAVPLLRKFTDVTANATSTVPGSAFVIAAIAVLLEASVKVSELYDQIGDMLGQITSTLGRFETYLESPPISARLSDIAIRTLVVILHLLGLSTQYCQASAQKQKKERRGKCWSVSKLRIKDFFNALLGQSEFKEKMDELQKLTNEEGLQVAADIRADVFELKEDAEYRRLKDWINPPDVSTSHNALLRRKMDSTCDWILEDEEFERWRHRPNSFYSILGHAGTGKSVLCSLIIERLRKEIIVEPKFTLAYFYFNLTSQSQSKDSNNRRALASALLFQIASSSRECWEYLRLEGAKLLGGGHPTDEQLGEMLYHVLKMAGPTIIVIDALDECQPRGSGGLGEQEAMLRLIDDMYQLELANLHMLVTSRPEDRILWHLAKYSCTRSNLSLQDHPSHHGDLRMYIDTRLSGPEFQRWDEGTVEKAKRALANTNKSQGMFLWVSLQLQHLEQCPANDVDDALDQLPEGLDGTYRGILDRFRPIGRTISRVRAVLGFIAFARRPLTPREVLAAFAFDFATAEVQPLMTSDADPEGAVLQYLPSLVRIVDWWSRGSKKSTVQFIHFSVKEYFTGRSLRQEREPTSLYYFDHYFANTSTTTLLLAALDQTPLKDLKDYAEGYWHEHVFPEAGDGEADLSSNPPDPDAWRNAAVLLNTSLAIFLAPRSSSFDQWNDSLNIHEQSTPLHLAARLLLHGHTQRLLEQGHYDVNVLDGNGETPLSCVVSRASFRAHLRIIDLLLSHGAGLHVRTEFSDTPVLLRALSAPDPTLVLDHLVEKGADVNATDFNGETALYSAVKRDSPSLVRALLRLGADMRADDKGMTPLHKSASTGNLPITQILLASGAEANLATKKGCTPLHFAAVRGHSSVALALLGREVEVEVRSTGEAALWDGWPRRQLAMGSTALHAAAQGGHTDVCEMLLKHSRKLVDIPDSEGQTPLHYASKWGCRSTVELLLKFGANADAVDDGGRTASDMKDEELGDFSGW